MGVAAGMAVSRSGAAGTGAVLPRSRRIQSVVNGQIQQLAARSRSAPVESEPSRRADRPSAGEPDAPVAGKCAKMRQERHAMRLLHTGPILFALAVGLAGETGAQMAPAIGGQEPPCIKDFVSLREDAQKRAAAIKDGMEK